MKIQATVTGFTLIELMISVVVLSIIAGFSAISLNNLFVKKRVENAAIKVYTDLRYAQSEAIKFNSPVYVSFSSTTNAWCYGMSLNQPCDCQVANSCKIVDQKKVTSHVPFKDVSLVKSKFAGNKNYTVFDPRKGFAIGGGIKNGTVWLSSANNELMAVVVSRTGRVRLCSPSINGYSQQCPKVPAL